MANSLVSLRLPESLVKELKTCSDKDHYLDLSEAIRSIVRDKWLEYKDPQAYHLKRLRKEISESYREEVIKKNQEGLIKELETIREMFHKDE
ncbi:MAG: hypothetical protein QS99_C0015G0035 [archaeon GW2011_AR4]|nr:MAG: hypothetical protein QS99_C0015G0035 [archaeon GW2011_AR4]HIJ03621.1 hypothetical protein [Candidatus Woesearchaeota archaeon]